MKRFVTSFSRRSFGVRNRSPWGSMLAHSLHQFHENDLFTSAAAMSYFGLMALFPALLLMLAISNSIAAGSQMLAQAVEVYPGSSKFLRDTIGAFSQLGVGAIVTCVILVFWAGSWVFAVAERALNRIWQATSRTFWHGRALTVGMVWQVIFAAGSYLITVALFVLIYRYLPRAEVTLRDTLPGAFFAGLLWELGKYIFAASLGYFHYDQIYGSVGAVVAVLTWSYVSSLIMLFGAQLTAVFHREHPA
jgi:membrane protein